MKTNPAIELMLNRKSIRKFTDETPDDETVEALARAAFQAPFAAQLGSLLLSRDRERNPFGAPLHFTVCVDSHRLEKVMSKRGWRMKTNDLSLLLFGIQDACYVAENLVIAAESLGMGSCFLGGAPYQADEIAERYGLPERVFPVVGLAVGYPAEDPPPRPRYPLSFSLFEDAYPDLTDEAVAEAMKEMDDGYLEQDYYRAAGYMVTLEDGREETFSFDDYSWTEHMGRKWGQWFGSSDAILEAFRLCGFDPAGPPEGD